MHRSTELEHLRKADANIAAALERIKRQTSLVAQLMESGQDTATATSVLQTMRNTLAAMQQHRRIIEKEIEG
jgi:urease gamma subunit